MKNLKSIVLKHTKNAERILYYLFFISLCLLFTIALYEPIYASEISGIINSMNTIPNIIRSFGTPLCTIVMSISGIGLMAGQDAKRWAKQMMLWAAIGLGVVIFAVPIVSSLNSAFGG